MTSIATASASPAATAPTITGTIAAQATTSEAPLAPFKAVTIGDANSGATDTLTITMSGPGGTLADGAGFSGLVSQGGGTYTLTGSAAAVTSELDALVFTPYAGQADTSTTTTFTLSDNSSAYLTNRYNDTPTVLANFSGIDGTWPFGGLASDAAGDLFGTTFAGGATNNGTVFELIKGANGYSGPVVLANLTTATGILPSAGLLVDSAGNLFGTTSAGGTQNGGGTVFEIPKTAAGYGAPVTLAVFNGLNGSDSVASLVEDSAGDLFGTTENGGPQGHGTVFELVKTATGYSAPVVLTSNATATTGYTPTGSLLIDAAGDLFGTASAGGAYGDGTVTELRKVGSGYSAPILLATFNGTNGAGPLGNLISDAAGNLYGTTSGGGAHNYGTVFELVKSGSGYSAPVTLASFDGKSGGGPAGGLVFDAAGDLFGTTAQIPFGNDGTLFELAKTASGYSAPITLYTFSFGSLNGDQPKGSLLIDAGGDLFGVTMSGGSSQNGTVIELIKSLQPTPTVDSTTTVINTDPAEAPTLTGTESGQVYSINAGHPFYGTTFNDPNANAYDTVTITLSGDGGTLSDGTGGDANLVKNSNGTYTLSGAAYLLGPWIRALTFAPGGAPGQTVTTTLSVSISSSAYPTPVVDSKTSVIYTNPTLMPTITGAQANVTTSGNAATTPFSGVTINDLNFAATDTLTIVMSGAGGTLADGTGHTGLVANGSGSYVLTGSAAAVTAELDALVFTPAAAAPGTSAVTTFTLSNASSAYVSTGFASSPTVLANFSLSSSLASAVIVDAAGNLFGVTDGDGTAGGGTVYEMQKTATGYSAPVILANFLASTTNQGPNWSGTNPVGKLVEDAAGDLFGTTTSGGKNGTGTVFEIVKTATGYSPLKILANFKANPGNSPYAEGNLVLDAAGDLFGVTQAGGKNNEGMIFEVANSPTGYGGVTALANFNGANGLQPNGGLTIDAQGDIFTTTLAGGKYNEGVVTEVVKTATGYSRPQTLFTFNGAKGAYPTSGLVADAAGDLFGTTAGNTAGTIQQSTVFELVKTATGYKPPKVLASFDPGSGISTYAPVVLDAAGDVFGTTDYGVFELVKTATGYSKPVTVAGAGTGAGTWNSFALTLDSTGNMFGVARSGGSGNAGSVSELPSANVTVSVTNTVKAAASAMAVAGMSATTGSVFTIAATPGEQIINGFVATGSAHDTLAVSKSVFADWAHLIGATRTQGSDLLITLSASASVLLTNVAAASFTVQDAKFV